MTFTYSTANLSTPLAKVRLEIGDTTEATALFQDEEINVKLAERGDDVLLTAADLCDILARKFARDFDFTTDGQSFSRSQKSRMYAEMAVSLRSRASGVVSIATTRVDGFSDDIDNESVDNSQENARRRYYGRRDFPY